MLARRLILTLCIVFVTCASFLTATKEKSIEEKFFDYVTGKGASYKALKEYQDDAKHQLEAGHLISLAWFYKGEVRIGMVFTMDNDGNYFYVKNIFNWETKNIKKGKFEKKKLNEIKELIKGIKLETGHPALGKEFYFAYRNGLKWKNILLDADKLPTGVLTLLKKLEIDINEK